VPHERQVQKGGSLLVTSTIATVNDDDVIVMQKPLPA
jgi:hypothetical protein